MNGSDVGYKNGNVIFFTNQVLPLNESANKNKKISWKK